ncbi:MAG: hypothetical protein HY811_11345 [Planctomycetes bacterium]|nr:hypothetical protein [Planctomycetota bacterium]
MRNLIIIVAFVMLIGCEKSHERLIINTPSENIGALKISLDADNPGAKITYLRMVDSKGRPIYVDENIADGIKLPADSYRIESGMAVLISAGDVYSAFEFSSAVPFTVKPGETFELKLGKPFKVSIAFNPPELRPGRQVTVNPVVIGARGERYDVSSIGSIDKKLKLSIEDSDGNPAGGIKPTYG